MRIIFGRKWVKVEKEIKHKPVKEKMEFSKRILLFSYFCAGTTFLYAMWIQFMMIRHAFHGDVGIVITLITSSGAMIVSGQGFYSWKTKALNMLKTELNPDYLKQDSYESFEMEVGEDERID